MLQVNHISVDLGNKQIINNLSFSFETGILVILGLNGSGKTTLLRSIAGLLKLQNGTIQIADINIDTLSRHKISRLISFVPQEFTTIFDFSVEEMILFGRTPYIKTLNLPSSYDYKVVYSIMHEMNIENLKNRKFNELSGGEKRLVLISMTLAQDTEILLFDEPTSFLDIKNAMLIIEKLKKLSTELKKTLIITMHDLNETIMLANKVLMICDYGIYKFGGVHELINEENLFELYKIHFNIESFGNNKLFIIPKNI